MKLKRADITPEEGDANQAVMKRVRERYQNCLDAESDNRDEGLEDLRFAKGEQWPDDIQTNRTNDHRPCLTINKMGQFIRQVVNDSRQNSPAIKTYPTGGMGSEDVCKIYNGMVRDIQQRTDADVAYDTAIEGASRCGEGYFRLMSRYTSYDTLEQELYLQRIRNPYSVHMDPAAIDPAGADSRYCFVDTWMSEEDFKAEYGTERMAGLDGAGLGQWAPVWLREGGILVTEYYEVEPGEERTLAMLKTGALVILEELPAQPSEDEIVNVRKVRVPRVVWRKVSGVGVLAKTVWPCEFIPVFRVIGEEHEIDGKLYLQGLVRPMKDSQRMYNYWVTSATEKGALESKAPYVGAEGQFEGHEHKWTNANHVPYAYLEYKMVELEGKLAPPPARNVTTFSGQADIAMAQRSSDDMKEVSGMYNAGLGAQSNETSGRAIVARQRESDTGTFHFVDNLGRAIRHCGRVMVKVIPKYYTGERVVRLLNEDDTEKQVTINRQVTEQDDQGNEVRRMVNDITAGEYDVRISTGPSYATRRLEAADSMLQFAQMVPELAGKIADLIAKNMDWPGADEIAERLRKLIPPELLGDEGDDDGLLTPAQVTQLIEQATAQLAEQFENSLAERDMAIKEAKAAAEVIDKVGPSEEQLREQVGGIIAEFLQNMGGGVESAPVGGQ